MNNRGGNNENGNKSRILQCSRSIVIGRPSSPTGGLYLFLVRLTSLGEVFIDGRLVKSLRSLHHRTEKFPSTYQSIAPAETSQWNLIMHQDLSMNSSKTEWNNLHILEPICFCFIFRGKYRISNSFDENLHLSIVEISQVKNLVINQTQTRWLTNSWNQRKI